MNFKTSVAGRDIADSFLWPKEEQDLLQIKFFAANLLADVFGREFGALDPREVECKCKYKIALVALFLTLSLLLPSFHVQSSLRNLARD